MPATSAGMTVETFVRNTIINYTADESDRVRVAEDFLSVGDARSPASTK
jgi:hypothetical protein